MNRQPVESSNITAIGFENGSLEVEFHNGRVYRYFDVSPEIYYAIIAAPSAGKAFNALVRNQFEYEVSE